MARGDPVYAKIDVEIFPTGSAFNELKPAARFLYLSLWALAVKERTDILPENISTDNWLSHWAHICPKNVSRWTKNIAKSGLIEILPNGRLFIKGVRDCHGRLAWDKCPVRGPNGAQVGHIREYESTREYVVTSELRGFSSPPGSSSEIYLKTAPDAESVAQRLGDPPPAEPPLERPRREARLASADSESAPNADPPGAVFKNSSLPGSGIGPIAKEVIEAQRALLQKRRALGIIEPPRSSGLEREVQAWFLELWPHGPYDWEVEKTSLLSQVRTHGRGAYNIAIGILREDRRNGKGIQNEIAWLNTIAREQSKLLQVKEL